MKQYLGYMTEREQREADQLISDACALLDKINTAYHDETRMNSSTVITLWNEGCVIRNELDTFRRRDEKQHQELIEKIREVCDPSGNEYASPDLTSDVIDLVAEDNAARKRPFRMHDGRRST